MTEAGVCVRACVSVRVRACVPVAFPFICFVDCSCSLHFKVLETGVVLREDIGSHPYPSPFIEDCFVNRRASPSFGGPNGQ